MPVYIALLRGINVGGHKKIIMADLKNHFEHWGFRDVKTYIQSGNIVFNSEETMVESMEQQISSGIQDIYGFKIPTWVGERSYLKQIAEKNPYRDASEAAQKVYFVFMTSTPRADLLSDLQAIKSENEEFTLAGHCIYLHCKNGYGNAKFNNNFFERVLKVETTARNFRTVNKLLALSGSLGTDS